MNYISLITLDLPIRLVFILHSWIALVAFGMNNNMYFLCFFLLDKSLLDKSLISVVVIGSKKAWKNVE